MIRLITVARQMVKKNEDREMILEDGRADSPRRPPSASMSAPPPPKAPGFRGRARHLLASQDRGRRRRRSSRAAATCRIDCRLTRSRWPAVGRAMRRWSCLASGDKSGIGDRRQWIGLAMRVGRVMAWSSTRS